MKKLYRVILHAQGGRSSEFPVDMLRYDGVSPYSEADSYEIARSLRGEPSPEDRRNVYVCRKAPANWKPTLGRWQSFGWNIVATRYEEVPS